MDQPRETLRFPGAIVFVASFVLMTLELVAGRFMAPYLGVSIFTWTSVIGVILAGISVGAWLGGRIADADLRRVHLATLFLLAGAATFLVLFLVPLIGEPLAESRMPLLLSALVFTTFTFLPAALLLGAVSPMVVKFALTDLGRTGRIVGRISAMGTLGSILGTFATGFFLVDMLGTPTIVRICGGMLIMLGALIHPAWKARSRSTAAIGLLFVSSLFTPQPCTKETQYYCIRISQTAGYDVLRLDHLVHSYVSRTAVGELGYAYEKVYATLIEASGVAVPRALYLGGGGYVMPRYVEHAYPGSANTVLEIDPGVTEIDHARLGLPRDPTIRTENRDARIALRQMPAGETYDFIFGDAFNDYAVPYHLTTREFDELIASHLSTNGLYAINVIDDPHHGRFVASTVKTLQQVFAHVTVVPLGADWRDKGRTTFVIIAGDADVPASFAGVSPRGVRMEGEEGAKTWNDIHYRIPDGELAAFVAAKKGIVLTDDYVPVDMMLAPLFSDSFVQ